MTKISRQSRVECLSSLETSQEKWKYLASFRKLHSNENFFEFDANFVKSLKLFKL